MNFVAEYKYKNEKGKTLYTIRRTADKQFIPKTPSGATNLDGIERVPYNLPAVAKAANTHEIVFLVEGEKSADRLIENGLVATCSAGGASWTWPRDWSRFFTGLERVYILPDNDEPGRKAAEARARVLSLTVNDVRIVELPGLDPKQDVWDWLEAGYDIDELWKICEAAPQYEVIKSRVSVFSESDLIAYMMIEKIENSKIFHSINSSDFTDPFWGCAFSAIQHFESVGLKADPPSIAAKMAMTYPLFKEDIESGLWKLYDKPRDWSHLDVWIKNVLDNSTKKSVERATVRVADAIKEGITGPDLIQVWETAQTTIRKGIVADDPPPNIKDFLDVPVSHDWLLPNFMERRDRFILVAPEGAGKAVFLRQMAIRAAAGIDIWDDKVRRDPVRCLMLDRENSPNQIRNSIRRPYDEANKIVGAGWYDNMAVRAEPSAINLLEPGDRAWFERQIVTFRPDIVFCLPIYKMFSGDSDKTSEKNAQEFVKIIDDLRMRYDIAVVFEAHAPTGTGDNRTRQMRPFGSSVWARWPELGWGLQASDISKRFKLEPFRGNRNDGIYTPSEMYWNTRPTGWQWLHQ